MNTNNIGLSPLFEILPYTGFTLPTNSEFWFQGYGPSRVSFDLTYRRDAYIDNFRVHPGIDYADRSESWELVPVVSVCDGVVVRGRINVWQGTVGTLRTNEEGVVVEAGITVRCFTSTLAAGDTVPRLSNMVIVYNHLASASRMVEIGEVVKVGDVLATTTQDINNYDHLDFQIWLARGFWVNHPGSENWYVSGSGGTSSDWAVSINPLLMFDSDLAAFQEQNIQPYYPQQLNNPTEEHPEATRYGLSTGNLTPWSLGGTNPSRGRLSNFWDAQDVTTIEIDWPLNMYPLYQSGHTDIANHILTLYSSNPYFAPACQLLADQSAVVETSCDLYATDD